MEEQFMMHAVTQEGSANRDVLTKDTHAHSDIAALAYALWQERGSPVGTPDDDWSRAEEELAIRHK